MSWGYVAVAYIGLQAYGQYAASKSAKSAAEASERGAGTTAEALMYGADVEAKAQKEALEYLKEREALPRQFSEDALTKLGGLYGLEGGKGDQQKLIDEAISSPLYQSIMGGLEAGEEAILRSASTTGGLRSGNVQEALYDYNTQLSNKALLESYNQQLQGLTGMAGLPTYAPQIAQGMAGIGATQAGGISRAGEVRGQGQIAAGQAQQAGQQQAWGNMMGMANLGVAAYGAGMFSDRRLKTNIKRVGEMNGHPWYTWDWNVVAQKMGLEGSSSGVLADDLVKTNPEAISFLNCFMFVDYIKLGIFPKEVARV